MTENKEAKKVSHQAEKSLLLWKLIEDCVTFVLSLCMIFPPCYKTKKGERSMFTNVIDFFLKQPDDFKDNLWFYLIYTILVLFQFFLAAYCIYQIVMDIFYFKGKKQYYSLLKKNEKEKMTTSNFFYISIICFLVYSLFFYLLTKKTVEKPITLFILIPSLIILPALAIDIYNRIKMSRYRKDHPTT